MSRRWFFLGLLGLFVMPCLAGSSKIEERKAIRLAWREAFDQGAHDDLYALYPGIRWKKPSRWKWRIVAEEEDSYLVEVSVKGRSSKRTGFFRRIGTWFLSVFPELLDHVRPPKPFGRQSRPGKWVATRRYRVWLEEEEIMALGHWDAAPAEQVTRNDSRSGREDVP